VTITLLKMDNNDGEILMLLAAALDNRDFDQAVYLCQQAELAVRSCDLCMHVYSASAFFSPSLPSPPSFSRKLSTTRARFCKISLPTSSFRLTCSSCCCRAIWSMLVNCGAAHRCPRSSRQGESFRPCGQWASACGMTMWLERTMR